MATGLDTGTYDALDTGTYEVLRDRLAAQATELARRAEALNARRTEEFGSTRLELTGTERIRTEHNCVPRDIVAVGDHLLFGYNVFLGLKPETTVADVFALHDHDLNRLPEDTVPGLLDDPAFVREFAALYRYYRQAHLLQLRRTDGKLLAVFQTGEKAGDIRVLRWALSDDGRATFLDARGERDHVFPPSHDFEWTDATREDHVLGRHPHVSVQGEVFVETVGGTLTVKIEDNTETGEGVYAEPVAEPLQSLADADIAHARVGALIPTGTWCSTPSPRRSYASTASGRPAAACPRTRGSSSRAATAWPRARTRPSTARTRPTWSSSAWSARPTARTCCSRSMRAWRAAVCCCPTT
ncbi:hypothetical protein GCM10010307_63610 [Streptomyces vastus]|uniref:DUF3686 domain-containing protein n=1 Tax=Streptomyces vastus TaxID=285451 RepID=A0ABP6DWP9_9ACTN